MSVHHTLRNTVLASVMAVAITGGLSVSAYAESLRTEGPLPSDPIMQLSQRLAPHDKFFLNSDENVELIRFTSKRDNKICVPRARHNVIGSSQQAIPLKVMWEDNTAVIKPGHCLSFDAKSVTVKPATALPDDTELVGTIHTSR